MSNNEIKSNNLSTAAQQLMESPNIVFITNSRSPNARKISDVHYQICNCVKKDLTEQSRKIMARRHSNVSVRVQRKIKKVTSLQRFLAIIGPKNS